MNGFVKEACEKISKKCANNKLPINVEYDFKRGIWEIYWEEVRKEEQQLADLGLERTHYMVK